MKLTLDRAPLAAALSRATRTVERRNTIPILANVLLRPDADGLALIATDLDIELRETLPAQIHDAGAGDGITLPAHILHDIVRKMPDGATIALELSGDRGTATLRASRSRFALQTLPAAEFPDLARVEGGIAFSLPGHALAEAMARVDFAISTEETRYYLNGIYLHRDPVDADRLRLVATDGHRLSLATVKVEGLPDIPGVIVPRKAVGELRRMAEAADKADVTLEVSTNKLAAGFGTTRFTTKLIDGSFPDYGRVIPADNTHRARLTAETLHAAVDRVSAVANERGRAVAFTFAEAGLGLKVTNADLGTAEEAVEIAWQHPDDVTIGFNGRYVLDMLGACMKTGEIEVALRDPGSPALFRRIDGDTPATDALCVLMPMRV